MPDPRSHPPIPRRGGAGALRPWLVAALVVGLAWVVAPVAGAVEREAVATIQAACAPWDGPAYALEIPLPASRAEPNPVLRVQLWGQPESPDPWSVRLPAAALSSDPSLGPGAASFQPDAGRSLPVGLEGVLAFRSLQRGLPVHGTYGFHAAAGKRTFRGVFRARWTTSSARCG